VRLRKVESTPSKLTKKVTKATEKRDSNKSKFLLKTRTKIRKGSTSEVHLLTKSEGKNKCHPNNPGYSDRQTIIRRKRQQSGVHPVSLATTNSTTTRRWRRYSLGRSSTQLHLRFKTARGGLKASRNSKKIRLCFKRPQASSTLCSGSSSPRKAVDIAALVLRAITMRHLLTSSIERATPTQCSSFKTPSKTLFMMSLVGLPITRALSQH